MSILKSENAKRAEALHPMAEKVANASARLKPLEQCTPQEARSQREEKGNPFAPPACDLAEIRDLKIGSSAAELMARMYSPHFAQQGLRPALVFFHGGGHVVGNVEQYDTFAQQLAFHGNCIVLSVEYRLAPETKSRGIYQDGFDSFQWLVANAEALGIDGERIAIGGDSAGANLAIAVCLMCKQVEARMPAYELLIYPATDYRLHYSSIEEFAQGYFLTKAGKQWFRDHFLEDESRAKDPIVSSMLADLSGLPESFVITAGFDPLRDEGKAFADRLIEHGVACRHLCYTDMIHGFVSFAGGIPAGMDALEEMGGELKRVLAEN
jgi:acetyl esterase